MNYDMEPSIIHILCMQNSPILTPSPIALRTFSYPLPYSYVRMSLAHLSCHLFFSYSLLIYFKMGLEENKLCFVLNLFASFVQLLFV